MRAYHRIAGAVVAAQIVAWVVTGMLFNVKYRYAEAYETLAPARPPAAARSWVSPADAISALGVDPSQVRRVRLLDDNRGYLYLVEYGPESAPSARLASAETAAPLAPLDAAGAEAALRSALAASPHAERYGAVASATNVRAQSATLGRESDAWQLDLDTGQQVTVDALTSEISHTSALNSTIDWTYRVHYMQYTPWKAVNIVLVTVFSALLFSLVVSGVNMLLPRRQARRSRYAYGGRKLRF